MGRVRVVLEGEKENANYRNGRFAVGDNVINPFAKHVISVEDLKPPRRPIASLPVGTVVKFRNGNVRRVGRRHLLNDTVSDGQRKQLDKDHYDNHSLWENYEILYEPEG